MSHPRAMEVWAGLFMALGFAALLLLSMKAGGSVGTGDGKSYLVKAYFSNVGNLKAEAPVKMAGVVIGRVADIRFNQERLEAEVSMRIDAAYDKLPADSSAGIYTVGLLGEQYIGLQAGGDTESLKNGAELTLTQSAMVLEQLIGEFLYRSAAQGGK